MNFSKSIFTIPQFPGNINSWHEHIPIAFFLVDILKPRLFAELGTHYGASYFAFCQAINELKLNTKAFAVDHWCGDENAGFYGNDVFEYIDRINNQHFAYFSRLLKMPFDEANALFENGSIDLLHIDGSHGYEDVCHDFDFWLPKMSDQGVILLHDTQVKEHGFGVWKLLEQIKVEYPCLEFKHGYGLAVICTGKKVNPEFLHFINTNKDDPYTHALFENLGRKILLEQLYASQGNDLDGLRKELEKTNSELLRLKSALAANERYSARYISENRELNKLLLLKGNNISSLEKQIIDKDQMVATLVSKIKSLNQSLLQQLELHTQSKLQIAQHVEEAKNLRMNVECLNMVISQLTHSLSWRLTRPFRLLKKNPIARYYKDKKNIRLIQKSKLFDANFYLETNPDVKSANLDPLRHYLEYGGFEGRFPSQEFDSSYYLSKYPEVMVSGMNPLVHFLRYGIIEGRISLPDKPIADKPSENNTIDVDLILNSGLFNKEYYLLNNPDVAESGSDPVQHYLNFGGLEGRCPSPGFNGDYYLTNNPDVMASEINPLVHYLQFGFNEGRPPLPEKTVPVCFSWNSRPIPETPKERLQGESAILFVGHDAMLAGAQQVQLSLIRWFLERTSIRVKIILLHGGSLLQKFIPLAPVLIWDELTGKIPDRDKWQVYLKEYLGPIDLVYGNTALAPEIYDELGFLHVPVITHVHELEKTLQQYIGKETVAKMRKFTNIFIACSRAVANNLSENHEIPGGKIVTIYEFIEKNECDFTISKTDLRKKIGLVENGLIVLCCGTVYWRKGPDLFIETAIRLKQKGLSDFHFYWIGEEYWDFDNLLPNSCSWKDLKNKISNHGLDENITFLGVKHNVYDYLQASDLFYLPSREDPFPIVCLEAAQCGVPVICFQDAGGMPEFVENDAGFVARFEDVDEVAEKIIFLDQHPEVIYEVGKQAKRKFEAHYHIDISAHKIFNLCRNTGQLAPAVSIIVPVYNCEKYLVQRLESILNQSFKDFEIIIIDDGSTDGSLEIAEKYAHFPFVRLLKNEANSGNPFIQWHKGYSHAKGEIIWFAEADDFSEPAFLRELLPAFNNEAVGLVYCDSAIVDGSGEITGNYQEYYNQLDPGHWTSSCQVTGTAEINFGLGVKNTIPNASAVLIRKRCLSEEMFRQAVQFRFSGDWHIYTDIFKEYEIAFCSDKLNYHRKHDQTVTSKFNTDPECNSQLLSEAATIHNGILNNFRISPGFPGKWKSYIKDQIHAFYPDVPEDYFDRVYPFSQIKERINNLVQNSRAKAGVGRYIFITTNDHFVNGGSEQLWIHACMACKRAGNMVAIVIKRWDPAPYYLNLFTDMGIDIIHKDPGHFQRIVGFNPDMVVISLGDQDEGTPYFQHCAHHLIPYVIVNHLSKEPEYWPIREDINEQVKTGYLAAQAVLFTGKNNQKVMEKRLDCNLPNAGIFFNPLDIPKETSTPFPATEKGWQFAIPANLSRIHKGQHLAIELFNNKKWRDRPVHLNIYGKGEDESILKKLARDYKMTNITFHGHIDNILTVWEKNHAILLPSFMEGLPLTLVGAMICRRVPIVTDVGAHTEVIDDNINGFIAKKPTVEALDEALERAFSRTNEWEEIGNKARSRILTFLPDIDPIEDFLIKIKSVL